MPMGMAEIAVALWKRHLRHNPANPAWPNRDRFVLSNGHGSMLLYSLLHLTGYDAADGGAEALPPARLEDPGAPGARLRAGRRDHHRAARPGHRQRRRHGARREAARRASSTGPSLDLVDHHTYVFLGDGCMMEGVSHEACALAGTLGLGKLIAFYDDNGISIDSDKGQIKQWYTDDVRKRFEAYGWQVIPNVDGHDVEAVDKAHPQGEAGEAPGRP